MEVIQTLLEHYQKENYSIIFDSDIDGFEKKNFLKHIKNKNDVLFFLYPKNKKIIGFKLDKIYFENWIKQSFQLFLIDSKLNIEFEKAFTHINGCFCTGRESRYLFGIHDFAAIEYNPKAQFKLWEKEKIEKYHPFLKEWLEDKRVIEREEQIELERLLILSLS